MVKVKRQSDEITGVGEDGSHRALPRVTCRIGGQAGADPEFRRFPGLARWRIVGKFLYQDVGLALPQFNPKSLKDEDRLISELNAHLELLRSDGESSYQNNPEALAAFNSLARRRRRGNQLNSSHAIFQGRPILLRARSLVSGVRLISNDDSEETRGIATVRRIDHGFCACNELGSVRDVDASWTDTDASWIFGAEVAHDQGFLVRRGWQPRRGRRTVALASATVIGAPVAPTASAGNPRVAQSALRSRSSREQLHHQSHDLPQHQLTISTSSGLLLGIGISTVTSAPVLWMLLATPSSPRN